MPEGPEVETVRRTLAPLLVGRVLGRPAVSRKALRTPTSSTKLRPLEGARVVSLGRHGKLLWINVTPSALLPVAEGPASQGSEARGERGLLVRLGMTGRLVVEAGGVPAHTHVRVPLDDGSELRYVDARRFGEVVYFATARARDQMLAHMGPDALAFHEDPSGRARATANLRATKRSLKDALLDQSVLAGVGNIYAAEALFQARLSPFLRGVDLDDQAAARLLDAVARVLASAVKHRGTSFQSYVDGRGERGDNLAHVLVFRREGEPCRVCGAKIKRQVQGQRSTFFCRRCQR